MYFVPSLLLKSQSILRSWNLHSVHRMQPTLGINISVNFCRKKIIETPKESLNSCLCIHKKILVPIDVYTPKIYLSKFSKSRMLQDFMSKIFKNFWRFSIKDNFLLMEIKVFPFWHIYIVIHVFDHDWYDFLIRIKNINNLISLKRFFFDEKHSFLL